MASRCETVLNTTMAEMDTYHTQKLEDFQHLTKEHLDGEIALYEQVHTGFFTRTPPGPGPLTFNFRSSAAYAPPARHSTSLNTPHSPQARASRQSTSASSSNRGWACPRSRNRARTCSTRRRCAR